MTKELGQLLGVVFTVVGTVLLEVFQNGKK
jgi:hypothetical protein